MASVTDRTAVVVGSKVSSVMSKSVSRPVPDRAEVTDNCIAVWYSALQSIALHCSVVLFTATQ